MTVWGAFTNHLRLGMDVWCDGYDTWTPSVNVYCQVTVGVDATWDFNDDQQVVLSGSAGGTWNYHNGLGRNGTMVVGTATIAGQGQNYGGGPTYTFSAQLNGNYLGAGPSMWMQWTLPPRPTRAPNPPGAPVYRNTRATSTDFGFADSTDYGGLNPDSYAVHIATDAGFANIIRNQNAYPAGTTITGLAPGTPYWGRTFTHNGAGWSGASGVTSFTTNAYALGAPTVTVTGPTTATVAWGDPPTSDPPTGWQVQYDTASSFATAQTLTGGSWAKSVDLSGLTPGTTYYARARANTVSGYGAWSPTVSSQTLSGAKVRVGGAWVDAPAYVRQGGAWVVAKVYKRVGGAWQL